MKHYVFTEEDLYKMFTSQSTVDLMNETTHNPLVRHVIQGTCTKEEAVRYILQEVSGFASKIQ